MVKPSSGRFTIKNQALVYRGLSSVLPLDFAVLDFGGGAPVKACVHDWGKGSSPLVGRTVPEAQVEGKQFFLHVTSPLPPRVPFSGSRMQLAPGQLCVIDIPIASMTK